MRIPIHPDDLNRNRGFNSLAKQLRIILHGPSRISLSLAKDILAKGFGYESFYDLEQKARNCTPNEYCGTENDAKILMSVGIRAATLSSNTTINEQALKKLIGSFALHSLIAFKPKSAPLVEEQTDLQQWLDEPQSTVAGQRIKSIAQLITASGNLRDQALLSCMRAGLRPHEYLSATHRAKGAIFVPMKKVSHYLGYTMERLPKTSRSIIKRYVKAQGLTDGDYLFPSSRDPKRPMTRAALANLLASWVQKANIESGPITLHGIRLGTAASQRERSRRINTW